MLAKLRIPRPANAAPMRRKRVGATDTFAARTDSAIRLERAIAAQRARRQTDAELARDVRAAVGARLGHIAVSLEVSVRNGEVMLDGDLESGNQKTIVDTTVGDLAGVRSVVNHMRIVSPSKLAMRTLYR